MKFLILIGFIFGLTGCDSDYSKKSAMESCKLHNELLNLRTAICFSEKQIQEYEEYKNQYEKRQKEVAEEALEHLAKLSEDVKKHLVFFPTPAYRPKAKSRFGCGDLPAMPRNCYYEIFLK